MGNEVVVVVAVFQLEFTQKQVDLQSRVSSQLCMQAENLKMVHIKCLVAFMVLVPQ